MPWIIVGSEPLSSLFFRKPGVYGAGASGPAAAGASYSYPPPSTVAGHIAGALVRAGLAEHPGPVDDGFGDVQTILRKVCGAARLRTGLLERSGDYYVYINKHIFPRLDTLREALRGIFRDVNGERFLDEGGGRVLQSIKKMLRTGPTLEATRKTPIRIALDRRSKTVLERHLYTRDEITYPPGTRIVSFLHCPKTDPAKLRGIEGPGKLGGEQGMASITLSQAGEDLVRRLLLGTETGKGDWLAVLVSPALLEAMDIPWNAGEPILVSDPDVAERLAEKLLAGRAKPKRARILLIPKGEITLEYLSTGWQTLDPVTGKGRYRRPYLWVPPGTTLYLEGIRGDEAWSIARNGLGKWSEVGWGTVILVPLP